MEFAVRAAAGRACALRRSGSRPPHRFFDREGRIQDEGIEHQLKTLGAEVVRVAERFAEDKSLHREHECARAADRVAARLQGHSFGRAIGHRPRRGRAPDAGERLAEQLDLVGWVASSRLDQPGRRPRGTLRDHDAGQEVAGLAGPGLPVRDVGSCDVPQAEPRSSGWGRRTFSVPGTIRSPARACNFSITARSAIRPVEPAAGLHDAAQIDLGLQASQTPAICSRIGARPARRSARCRPPRSRGCDVASVADHHAVVLPGRVDGPADVAQVAGASRVEPAAGRRSARARQRAVDRDARPLLVGRQGRHRRDQSLRVRVMRRLEELCRRSKLDEQ